MNKYKRYFVLQHDQKDCGCACLNMIVKYYGGIANLEHLKELSGTTAKGTSMLGLIQASKHFGLRATAYQASIEDLKKIKTPCILHVEVENNFYHYVTYFSFEHDKFFIGDPAIGLKKYTETELLNIWKNGYLLVLETSGDFKRSEIKKNIHFKWLLGIIKEDNSFYISAVFLGLMIAFLSMATLVFTEKLIDVIIPSRDKMLLFKSIAAWSFLLLLTIVLSYIRSTVLIKQAYRFNTRIIRYFFKRLLFMPKVFFDSKRQGDMISRMNDTGRLQQNIKTIIADSFIELAMLLMSFVFLLYYSASIGLLMLIALPILYLGAYRFNDKIKILQHKMFVNYALTESNYIDSISGIEVIKSFTKEHDYAIKNIKIYSNFQKYIAALHQKGINQITFTNLSGTIISISGIMYAIILVFNHDIKIGDMIAIISLILLFIESTNSIVQLNFDIFESKIALERMFDFVERSKEIENEYATNPVNIEDIETLKIKNISFAYPGQDYLIKNATLSLKRGEITALIGESGSGKSTIIQILLKFYKASSGKIIVNNNIAFQSINVSSWRNAVAYVPQNIKIFNTTLLGNISLDENINENKVISFCENLGFDKYFSNFQDSYWTMLGEEGINISGGEKQLVALARALFSNPKVLLLDEVSASMDEKTEQFVLEILLSQKTKFLTLFITHKKELVKEFSDIVFYIDNKHIKKGLL